MCAAVEGAAWPLFAFALANLIAILNFENSRDDIREYDCDSGTIACNDRMLYGCRVVYTHPPFPFLYTVYTSYSLVMVGVAAAVGISGGFKYYLVNVAGHRLTGRLRSSAFNVLARQVRDAGKGQRPKVLNAHCS
jgi:hypothetical protein